MRLRRCDALLLNIVSIRDLHDLLFIGESFFHRLLYRKGEIMKIILHISFNQANYSTLKCRVTPDGGSFFTDGNLQSIQRNELNSRRSNVVTRGEKMS